MTLDLVSCFEFRDRWELCMLVNLYTSYSSQVGTSVGLHGYQYSTSIMESKEPTRESQNCNATQILIFGGHFKVGEYLYARVNIWVILPSETVSIQGRFYPRYDQYSTGINKS